MSTVQNFGAYLSNLDAVREAAQSLDRVQTRGKAKGQGSVRAMLEDIGNGKVVVVAHEYEAAQLHQLAGEVELLAHSLPGEIKHLVLLFGYALTDAATAMEASNRQGSP